MISVRLLQFRKFAAASSIAILTTGMFNGCTASGVRDSATHSKKEGAATVSPLSVTVEDPSALAKINSLAILPPTFAEQVRGAKIDEITLAELVENTAVQELDLKVYGREWVAKVANGNASAGVSQQDRVQLKKNGVDGVLQAEVLEYVERSGSSVGGEPASVAFRLSVIHVPDGKSIWQGTYAMRQEALTDNLLKIGDRLGKDGSGAGWETSGASFQKGLVAAFRDFRTRREEQFLAGKR